MAIYTTAAVLSKLDADLKAAKGHATVLGNDVAVGKLYCQIAFETIDENLDSLFKNKDEAYETVSNQLTGIHTP